MIRRTHLLALILMLCCAARAAAAQGATCLAPGDSSSAQMAMLTQAMRATSSPSDLRTDMGLTALDTTDMHLVTNDSVCAGVDSAMMAAGTPQIFNPFVVYALGTTRYAAFKPGERFTTIFFLDDKKKVLGYVAAGGGG